MAASYFSESYLFIILNSFDNKFNSYEVDRLPCVVFSVQTIISC